MLKDNKSPSSNVRRALVDNGKKIYYIQKNPNIFGTYMGVLEPNKFQTSEGVVDMGTYTCRLYKNEDNNVTVKNLSNTYRDHMRRLVAISDGEKAEDAYRTGALRVMSIERINAEKILSELDKYHNGAKYWEMKDKITALEAQIERFSKPIPNMMFTK